MKILAPVAIFFAAFLLFSVQLMVAKWLLPQFGGTASVWNTSMMFFQTLLLAGYAYAHWLGTLRHPWRQVAVHGLAWAGTIMWLGLDPGLLNHSHTVVSEELSSQSPVIAQLMLMSMLILGPFVILSASAPLIQKWVAITVPSAQATLYQLYAVSNIGALAALVLYPLAIEPSLTLEQQKTFWSWAMGGLAILFLAIGVMVARVNAPTPARSLVADDDAGAPLTGRQKFLFVALSFLPAALSLAATNKIATDIASLPLLWAIVLGIYLLSFVAGFKHRPLVAKHWAFAILMVTSLAFFAVENHIVWKHEIGAMGLTLLVFAVAAYIAHRTLYEQRPAAKYLTAYYLWIALGGALASLFIGLVIPVILPYPLEFTVILTILILVVPMIYGGLSWPTKPWQDWLAMPLGPQLAAPLVIFGFLSYAVDSTLIVWVAMLLASMLAVWLVRHIPWMIVSTMALMGLCLPGLTIALDPTLYRERNYFGIIQVVDTPDVRQLIHGNTIHGVQARHPDFKFIPLSYYSLHSPVADVFRLVKASNSPATITVIGLGAGTTACMMRGDDHGTFIEIDPSMARLAMPGGMFSFLENCQPQARVIVGDGRLALHDLPDHSQNLIVVDAFSSDSVPFHLITREAVMLYAQKLVPNGLIAFNVSNRYFDLVPELGRITRNLSYTLMVRKQKAGVDATSKLPFSPSIYAVIAPNQQTARALRNQSSEWWEIMGPTTGEPWSDQKTWLLRALRGKITL
jgi:spermidine synthase